MKQTTQAPIQQPIQKKKMSKNLKIAIGIPFSVILLAFIIATCSSNKSNQQPQTQQTNQAQQAQPTEQKKEETKQEEQKPGTTKDKIDKIVKDEIENSDELIFDEQQGKVVVEYTVETAWSEKTLLQGAYFTFQDIAPKLFEVSEVKRFKMTTKGIMIDQYGQESAEDLVRLSLNRETNDKINWSNISPKNIPYIVDDFYIHPSLGDANLEIIEK